MSFPNTKSGFGVASWYERANGSLSMQLLTTVDLKNIGPTCRLQGYPALVGIFSSGTRPLTPVEQGTYFGNEVAANLTTGAEGKLLLGTDDACSALNQPNYATVEANAAANTYTAVVIILPNGGGSVAVANVTFDTACGLDESQLGVPPPIPVYSPRPGSFESLVATIRVAHTVRWGTTLRYQLLLHNPSKTAVSLRPCPNYDEALYTTKDAGTAASKSYRLNCDGVRVLASRSTVSFDMELHLPKSKAASKGEIAWNGLNTDDEPFTTSTIQVVG